MTASLQRHIYFFLVVICLQSKLSKIKQKNIGLSIAMLSKQKVYICLHDGDYRGIYPNGQIFHGHHSWRFVRWEWVSTPIVTIGFLV